jgi:membrane-associated phospholipid phosphatase
MPFVGVLFMLFFDEYYYLQTSPQNKLYILGFIFLVTFLLPFLVAVLLQNIGQIGSLEMYNKEERKLPILITAFIYTALFFMIARMNGFDRIRIFLLATTIALIISGFITNYYKISIHMLGVGGIVGLVAYMSTYSLFNLMPLLVGCIVFSGLVGVARIQLKAHTPMQVYSGFAFGFAVVFLMGVLL